MNYRLIESLPQGRTLRGRRGAATFEFLKSAAFDSSSRSLRSQFNLNYGSSTLNFDHSL